MLLDMRDICKDYRQGKEAVPVLKNVCLQVEQGDYVAIMGPSGSGKTTLMNVIGCLDVPTSGEYLFDGESLKDMNEGALAELRNRSLGFVFQSFYLLPKLSALDNVALPLLYAGVSKKERRARAAEALEKVGLTDRMHFKPNQLSGGQCQRVAIARAMIAKPKLLLADEPTGALDTASGTQIMDIFEELNDEGVTIVMITHEREVAERAKRVCYIRDGVLSGGAPELGHWESSKKADKTIAAEGITEEAQKFVLEPQEIEEPMPAEQKQSFVAKVQDGEGLLPDVKEDAQVISFTIRTDDGASLTETGKVGEENV